MSHIEKDCDEYFVTCEWELEKVWLENTKPITSLKQKFKRQVSLSNLRV